MSTSYMIAQAEIVTKKLKLIANPNRLRILCRLLNEEMAVGDLETELNIRQPTLSRELSRLRENNILTARRKSKVVFYSFNDQQMRHIIEVLCETFKAQARPSGPEKSADNFHASAHMSGQPRAKAFSVFPQIKPSNRG